MPLIGWPLPTTLAIASVFVLLFAHWVWHRAAQPRLLRAGIRVGTLAAGQLLALLLVATLLNNYAYFFTSWRDLVGAPQPPAPRVLAVGVAGEREPALVPRIEPLHLSTRHVGAADFAPLPRVLYRHDLPVVWPAVELHRPVLGGRLSWAPHTRGLVATTWSARSEWTRYGAVFQAAIRSGRAYGTALLYVPPTAFEAEDRRLPLLVVYGDRRDTPLSMLYRSEYPADVAGLIRTGRLPPALVAMVPPSPAAPCATEDALPADASYYLRTLPLEVAAAVSDRPPVVRLAGVGTGGPCALGSVAVTTAQAHPTAGDGGGPPILVAALSMCSPNRSSWLPGLVSGARYPLQVLVSTRLGGTGGCSTSIARAVVTDVRPPVGLDWLRTQGGPRDIDPAPVVDYVFEWLARGLR